MCTYPYWDASFGEKGGGFSFFVDTFRSTKLQAYLYRELSARVPLFSKRVIGAIAQLVEHLDGIEVVWGSSPHGSIA